MKIFYSELGAEAGPYLEVIFDGDEVSLDIPEDGITLPSGWSLRPLTYPSQVMTCSMCDCKIHSTTNPPCLSYSLKLHFFSAAAKACGQLPAWQNYPLLPD